MILSEGPGLPWPRKLTSVSFMTKQLLKRMFRLGGIEVCRYDKVLSQYECLFEKYRDLTMIPKDDFILNLELCNLFKDAEGDYAECGVWRGGMSAAVAEILGKKRQLHLFDSFEGLPPAKEIDGVEALAWQQDSASLNFNNCTADESCAIEAMKRAGHENYTLYKGWFEKTLPESPRRALGILRLDGDWYDSIMTCLDCLYPRVVEGGLVILDDYYFWEGCAKAVHDYLSKTKSRSRVYQWRDRVAYINKR
jgi:O-methyltransferase